MACTVGHLAAPPVSLDLALRAAAEHFGLELLEFLVGLISAATYAVPVAAAP